MGISRRAPYLLFGTGGMGNNPPCLSLASELAVPPLAEKKDAGLLGLLGLLGWLGLLGLLAWFACLTWLARWLDSLGSLAWHGLACLFD